LANILSPVVENLPSLKEDVHVSSVSKWLTIAGEIAYAVPSTRPSFYAGVEAILKSHFIHFASIKQEVGRQIGIQWECDEVGALKMLQTVVAHGDGNVGDTGVNEIVAYLVLRSVPMGNLKPLFDSRDIILTHLVVKSATEEDKSDAETRAVTRLALYQIARCLPILRHEMTTLFAKVDECVVKSSDWQQKALFIEILAVISMNLAYDVAVKGREEIKSILLRYCEDEKPEVRMASTTALSNLLKVYPISLRAEHEEELFAFVCDGGKARSKMRAHALAAIILSHPYDLPLFMPKVLSRFGRMTKSFSSLIQHTLGEFRRTHQDTWREEQRKFSADDLDTINEVIAPPSYYA